jgi:PAS domain S-box-containing protein
MPKTDQGQRYHKALDRYIRRYFNTEEAEKPEFIDFLDAVNNSFLQIEENRLLYERAMALSSKELADKNKELEAQSERQKIIIANISNSIKNLGVELHGEQDLLKVADILSREIERRVQAEERTRLSEEKFRSIIEHMQLGLVESDLDGKITHVYNWFLKMSGYTAEEIIGKPAKETLLDRASWPELDKQLESRKRGEYGVYEALLKRKHGENMWVIISGAPLFDLEKRVIGSVGIFFDITHQKLTEEALDLALKESEKAMKAREMFFAVVSHEIRTPMNAILGMSHLLADTTLTGDQREYLNAIRTSADGLMGIINDILDLSKIKSGKFNIERVEFNLVKLLRDMHQTINVKAREKKLDFLLEIDNEIEGLYSGDPVRIRQILINLTGNAVKFTSKGQVRLSVKILRRENDTDSIRFEVEDTGIGIAKEKFALLFETFTQVHSPEHGSFEGTGLGLSISRQLVELMSGELKVESEVGKGSCFSFVISLPKCNTRQEENTGQLDFKGLENRNVLLVEDNAINRFLASTILKKWHINVTEAESGEDALALVRENHFDTIIMDMQMPRLDGLEASRKIRGMGIFTPIIALTANAYEEDREKCIEAGMNAFISKPFNPETLFEALTSAIFKKKEFYQIGDRRENTGEDGSELPGITIDELRQNLPALRNQLEQLISSREFGKAEFLAISWVARVEWVKARELALTLRYLARACENRELENALEWTSRFGKEADIFLKGTPGAIV